MSLWLFYALLAPFLFAVVNIFDKSLREKHLGTATLTLFVGLSSFWIIAVIPFVELEIPAFVAVAGLMAGAMFFFNGFPYFQALSIEEASRVIPLWALEAPITLLLAFIFLNEKLTVNGYIGFSAVVAGAFLISTKKLKEAFKLSKAFLLMLLASFITAIGLVIGKWLYAQTSFWAVQVLLFLGAGIAALLTFLIFTPMRKAFVKQMLSANKAGLLQLLSREVVFIAAALLFSLAIMTGSVSLSVALVQLTALYVFVIATAISLAKPSFLKETGDKKTLLIKAVAIALIIAGVFAISL